jgi:hypothetical protein
VNRPSREPVPAQDLDALKVVVFSEGDGYVAVVLDHCLAAQAKTVPELKRAVTHLVLTQLIASAERGQAPFVGLPRAPKRYWRLWEDGVAIDSGDIGPPPGVFSSFPTLSFRVPQSLAA